MKWNRHIKQSQNNKRHDQRTPPFKAINACTNKLYCLTAGFKWYITFENSIFFNQHAFIIIFFLIKSNSKVEISQINRSLRCWELFLSLVREPLVMPLLYLLQCYKHLHFRMCLLRLLDVKISVSFIMVLNFGSTNITDPPQHKIQVRNTKKSRKDVDLKCYEKYSSMIIHSFPFPCCFLFFSHL